LPDAPSAFIVHGFRFGFAPFFDSGYGTIVAMGMLATWLPMLLLCLSEKGQNSNPEGVASKVNQTTGFFVGNFKTVITGCLIFPWICDYPDVSLPTISHCIFVSN
jgi:hypothetical protein